MKSTQYFKKNKKGLECLNCGQPISYRDNFCSNCGQVNDELPLSIKQFISEFFAGFLSFDTRFFNTIVPLLFKPGKVSKEYIEGKRRKYTNPFKLYLHTSIVFFLLMGLHSTISNFKNYKNKEYGLSQNEELKDSIFTVLEQDSIQVEGLDFAKKYRKKLDSVFKEIHYKSLFNSDKTSNQVKDSLYQTLVDVGMQLDMYHFKLNYKSLEGFDFKSKTKKAQKAAVEAILASYFRRYDIHYSKKNNNKSNYINKDDDFILTEKITKFYNFSKKHKDLSVAEALDSLGEAKTWMNLFKYQKACDLNKLQSDKDFQKMYLKSIVSKISIALFFLLPILALLYGLLYWRHRYGYTEHLVVVFNIQTVFFIILIIGFLLEALFKTDFFTPILQLLFVFYIYKTLRNFYKQGRFKTIIKFIMINIGYFVMATIGVLLISFIAFIV